MNKPGRNDPCYCGSGKKYKKCCEAQAKQPKKFHAEVITSTSKMASLFSRSASPVKSAVSIETTTQIAQDS